MSKTKISSRCLCYGTLAMHQLDRILLHIYIYVVHNNLWVLVSGLLSVRHEVCVFTSYKYTNIQKFLGLDKIRTRRMW